MKKKRDNDEDIGDRNGGRERRRLTPLSRAQQNAAVPQSYTRATMKMTKSQPMPPLYVKQSLRVEQSYCWTALPQLHARNNENDRRS